LDVPYALMVRQVTDGVGRAIRTPFVRNECGANRMQTGLGHSSPRSGILTYSTFRKSDYTS
jgi:hypothetical protein